MEERQVRTGIDKFLDLVNSSKELRLSDASKKLGVEEATLEIWADVLHQDNLVEIGYDSFGKMIVKPMVSQKAPAAPAGAQNAAGEASASGRIAIQSSGLQKAAELKTVMRGILKKKSSKHLLKKYAKMRRETEKNEVRRETGKNGIVSKVMNLLGAPFGRSAKASVPAGNPGKQQNKARVKKKKR